MKRRLILGLVMVTALLAGIVTPAGFALAVENHAHVTVTGAPSFISITQVITTWTINDTPGGAGNGFMEPSTTYYANPADDAGVPSDSVTDGQCYFTVTNASSTIPLTLTVNWGNFSGGDAMTNSDTGSATATSFGAYSYCTGMTYSSGKVVAKVTGSSAMKTSWTTATLKWGLAISTRTDAWASGDAQTSTVTITATAT